jgi:uncharacterized iron-regulated membrane protein
MAWHHVTGLVGGVFVLTWMFSGWLSLNPGDYFAGRNTTSEVLQRYAGHDAPDIAARAPKPEQGGVVEARFVWLDGTAMMILEGRYAGSSPVDPTSGAPIRLTPDRLWTAAAKLIPDAHLTGRLTLQQYDAYWYAHHNERELPVLRAVFDDAARSWFHLSPITGDIVGRVDESRRTYRWLFNALHSLDFQLLVMYRPAWDIVMVLLSMLGTIISVSGIVIGWRYLWR